MLHLTLAVATLLVIIWTSLRVEALWQKCLVYVGLGLLNILLLVLLGHNHEAWEAYAVDYPQFIPIPLCSVLVAGLGLFTVRVRGEGRALGWFLFLLCPLIGNLGTTWALIPILLSLVPALLTAHPSRWREITVLVAMFAMNFLALGTLAADPPQAYWAVKAGDLGQPLAFLFPAFQFWPYLLCTTILYAYCLRQFGVRFGSLAELLSVQPVSWPKCLFGVVLVAFLGLVITRCRGYEVTLWLGAACALAGLGALCLFGPIEREHCFHWSIETAAIFVGFFAVVAQAHAAIHALNPPRLAMIPVVAGMTAWADNAAAFAVGYPRFEDAPQAYMVWYNLFPAVTFGGSTPLGNGPQITLLLVVMAHLKFITPGEVFAVWFRVVGPFLLYLLIWLGGMAIALEHGYEPGVPLQATVGTVALLATVGLSASRGTAYSRGLLSFLTVAPQLQPEVAPQLSHLQQAPLRTSVNCPHSEQGSPS